MADRIRHSGAGRNPGVAHWTPAFAGVTELIGFGGVAELHSFADATELHSFTDATELIGFGGESRHDN